MKKKNMFEGANFGSKFMTRDGRESVLVNWSQNRDKALLYIKERDIEDFGLHDYYLDGQNSEGNSSLDIVSKYHESIDEEKLDTIARKNTVEFIVKTNSNSQEGIGYFSGFRQGYRKAKEEE